MREAAGTYTAQLTMAVLSFLEAGSMVHTDDSRIEKGWLNRHPLGLTLLLLLSLWSLASSLVIRANPAPASPPQAANQVEVGDDSLAVHSEMSSTSAIVKTLKKGDRAVLLLRMDTSEGAWCKIAESGPADALGYVPCSGLSRGSHPQVPNSAASGPGDSIPPCVKASAPQKLSGGGKIYFVPVGDFPPRYVEYLRDCYQRRFGLDIRALAPLAVELAAMDQNRHQLIAERLFGEMTQAYSKLAAQPGVVLIGLTTQDMYALGEPHWNFVFGWKSNRYSLVSTARFIVPYYDGLATESVILERLRKVVGRYLGILYYRLPPNSNPKSLLYPNLLGVDDLDALGEDF